MFALLLLTAWLRPCAAQGNQLVMATTFSPSATVWIIDRWQKEPGSVMIRTLNRTSASLEQLLDTANAENVDLILTSSPMLLQHLQEHQKLGHCCKVSDEAAFCLIQRPYISKTLLTRRISPRGSP